jgi:glycosyltransferase involved in cell wall biosynthesis
MTRLVCIIGTDGSGKTTLSDALVERLHRRGERAERAWLGSDNYLMAPVRAALKLIWARRRGKGKRSGPKPGLASQRVDYAAEIARKNALAARHPIAVRIYLALVWLDYWLQLAIKRIGLRRAGIIVADRYLFDVAVNLGLTLGWKPEEVVRYAQTRIARIALPEVRVFLRVEAEVSMARKDDVFDIDYLRMRLSYYDAIAEAFGFTVRDGTLPIAQNADWLAAEVAAAAARPYVIYVHSNNVDVGGADKVLALMARHMRDHGRAPGQHEGGCRVAVALRLATSILHSHAAAGVPVFLFPFERPQTSHGLSGLVRLVLQAPGSIVFFWRLFGRERPDIVHVNDLYDFLPAMVARSRRIPVVWHVRMIPNSVRMRAAFAKLLSIFATRTVFISRAVAGSFPGVQSQRSQVIYDFSDLRLTEDPLAGADPDPRPAPLPDGGRLVVMVGRVEPWKGQDVFLAAVADLPEEVRRQHVFALVGGPVPGKEDYFARIASQAARLGVIVMGARADVPDILRSADISVHCSVTPEPLGAVVLESMLAGTLTIATESGGVPEIITDLSQGLMVPPAQPGTLAVQLRKYLEHPSPPRSLFGAAARARVLHMIDKSRLCDELLGLYTTATLGAPNRPKTME